MNIEKSEENAEFIPNRQLNTKKDTQEINIELKSNSKKLTKFHYYKDLIAISVSFFFVFASYGSIASLQSVINSKSSLGTISLFVISITFALSCLFLPSLFIEKFGYKWSVFLCEIGYCTYSIANLYPKWWILMPCK